MKKLFLFFLPLLLLCTCIGCRQVPIVESDPVFYYDTMDAFLQELEAAQSISDDQLDRKNSMLKLRYYENANGEVQTDVPLFTVLPFLKSQDYVLVSVEVSSIDGNYVHFASAEEPDKVILSVKFYDSTEWPADRSQNVGINDSDAMIEDKVCFSRGGTLWDYQYNGHKVTVEVKEGFHISSWEEINQIFEWKKFVVNGEECELQACTLESTPSKTICAYSLDEIETMRVMAYKTGDAQLQYYLDNGGGGGAKTREELIEFLNVVDTIPFVQPTLPEDGKIALLAYQITTDNLEQEHKTFTVSLALGKGTKKYMRMEYDLSCNALEEVIRRLVKADGRDVETYAGIDVIKSGRMEIYTERKGDSSSMAEWDVTIDDLFVHISYTNSYSSYLDLFNYQSNVSNIIQPKE